MTVDPTPRAIRRAFLDHLRAIGLAPHPHLRPVLTKDTVRALHAAHRADRDRAEAAFVSRHLDRLAHHFADGRQIDPARVSPELVPVASGTDEAALFRVAARLWSVPVSRGFGRRLRYLVRDRRNGTLVGLLALGSPVFNLAARDAFVGWTVRDREARLTRVMDAYVLGAVEPYASLLGGKLVGALVASAEVAADFATKYAGAVGRISGRADRPDLTLVTTTSALGRSSVYNRLRLRDSGGSDLVRFRSVGFTAGHGHFHVPEPLFDAMRELLVRRGRAFAASAEYGSGPNRRLRILREGLEAAGVDAALARHGVRREVFCVPTVPDWRAVLLGDAPRSGAARPSAEALGRAAVERWVAPRAARRPGFRTWTRDDTLALLRSRIEPGRPRGLRPAPYLPFPFCSSLLRWPRSPSAPASPSATPTAPRPSPPSSRQAPSPSPSAPTTPTPSLPASSPSPSATPPPEGGPSTGTPSPNSSTRPPPATPPPTPTTKRPASAQASSVRETPNSKSRASGASSPASNGTRTGSAAPAPSATSSSRRRRSPPTSPASAPPRPPSASGSPKTSSTPTSRSAHPTPSTATPASAFKTSGATLGTPGRSPTTPSPGRRMLVLVRDRSRPRHPVVALGALSSSAVQITVRDRAIGWHPLALDANDTLAELIARGALDHVVRLLADGNPWRAAEWIDGDRTFGEDSEDPAVEPSDADLLDARVRLLRAEFDAEPAEVVAHLSAALDRRVAALYVDDLDDFSRHHFGRPSEKTLERLAEIRDGLTHASRILDDPDTDSLVEAAESPRYTRKRIVELHRLLRARRLFQTARAGRTPDEAARWLLAKSSRRLALKTALREIKKGHVAASIMDVTTCGAVAPYNQLLGGKLAALLVASPAVVDAYRERYQGADSHIASRMQARPVQRPADLALLCTTSLYGVGSSQYNRLRVRLDGGPGGERRDLAYHLAGKTLGFGTVHVAADTYEAMKSLLEVHARQESSRFGAGVNVKMRTVGAALALVGLHDLQRHQESRLVYLAPLAPNWRRALLGLDDAPDYPVEGEGGTAEVVAAWKKRYLVPRALRTRDGHGEPFDLPEQIRAESRVHVDAKPPPLGPLFDDQAPEDSAEADPVGAT